MTEDDQRAIGGQIGALMAAHAFSIYAVVAALAEQGYLSQDRVVVWAETFAELFDSNPKGAENKDAAAHLRNFAMNLRTMCTIPEGAGRA